MAVINGKPRWRVNDPHGPDGKRQRKFFDTREAAERYARQRTEDRRAYGIHFATIPPAERASLGCQLSRLRALGWGLPAAVDFIERHGKAPPSLPLGRMENPALAVDSPRLDEKPPGIITPDQASTFLDACLDVSPDIVPTVVLCLFGGLRRAEAEKIEWAEIGPEFIEIKAHKAKTRHRRLVPITAHLLAWLDCARAVDGKLPAVNYADKFKRALEKAKLRANWPQNGLRHSFASYHYAKNRNENETAAMMGNSPQMVFAHYRELVRPAQAEAFFGLMPPPDALARAQAARAHLARPLPPRHGASVLQELPEACAA